MTKVYSSFNDEAFKLCSVSVTPSALPASPLQVNRECGFYNSAYDKNWQSLSCESALPYICKKTPNDTRRAEPLGKDMQATSALTILELFVWIFGIPLLFLALPLTENWQYIRTKCDDGWWPHNGFCYRVLPESEAGSWQKSSGACSSQGANLTSIHSLSELEMLLRILANGEDHTVAHNDGGNAFVMEDKTVFYLCLNAWMFWL